MPRTEQLATSWQVPSFDAPGDVRQAWVEEQLEEGEGWLSNQRAYKDLARNIKIFDAIFEDGTKSTLVSNELKYNIRKFIETISEVREIGSYGSDAKQFKPYAEMINKVAKGVYIESQFPRQIRKALQFATVMGRGYIWPKCKTTEYGYGERQIVFEPLGPLDVVPVQIPSDNDVQKSYVVTIFEYMPIAEAHAKFPLFQSQLLPISGVSYQSRVQARRVDYAEKFRYGEQNRNWGNLYCEIRRTFIRDLRLNIVPKGRKTGMEIPMGEPGTTWFYTVPWVGQEIVGGIRDGKPYMRKATNEDCRIYPFLRQIITSRDMKQPMYDGPAFDWHGCIPPVQYDVDDWAWEGMGRSLVQDVGSIEMTKRKHERKMDQVLTTKMNPPLGYDRTATGGPKIENFDIFGENTRAGLDGKPKDVLQSLLPDEVRVDAENFKFLEMLSAMEKTQLGINDLGGLAALKMNITGENIDKALEPIGPIAKGIAAGMEAANAKVAYMLKFMIPQWFDTKRIIEYIGPDNVTPDVFDLDPNSMIPSHMPDEYKNAKLPFEGEGDNMRVIPSYYPMLERARRFAKNLRLISVPSTLLKITQQQEQLKLMTLKRQNAPIGWCDILPKLGVDNYGSVKGDTVRERWMNEELENIKFKIEEAKLAAAAGIDLGGGGEKGGGKGQGKGGGRPASGKKGPQQYQKGGAGGDPRTGIKES
jgi:hypothetical protein